MLVVCRCAASRQCESLCASLCVVPVRACLPANCPRARARPITPCEWPKGSQKAVNARAARLQKYDVSPQTGQTKQSPHGRRQAAHEQNVSTSFCVRHTTRRRRTAPCPKDMPSEAEMRSTANAEDSVAIRRSNGTVALFGSSFPKVNSELPASE